MLRSSKIYINRKKVHRIGRKSFDSVTENFVDFVARRKFPMRPHFRSVFLNYNIYSKLSFQIK